MLLWFLIIALDFYCRDEYGVAKAASDPLRFDELLQRPSTERARLRFHLRGEHSFLQPPETSDARAPVDALGVNRSLVAVTVDQCMSQDVKNSVPVRVSSLNNCISFFVSGPGLPSPIGCPSRLTIGMTSAAVPVKNASSAS